MLEPLTLLGFLGLGLVGGFGHCVGMCAPFVLWVADRFGGPATGAPPPGAPTARAPLAHLAPQLLYGLGRTTTYAALGALAGLLGSVVDLALSLVGVQRAAAVVAGAILVLYALAALAEVVPLYPRGGGALFGRIAARLRRRQPAHPYVAGLFLGFLPCGLLYGALIAAAATGDALRGAVSLALFGIGTVPALLGLALLADVLRQRRALLNTVSQLFILAMGGWFVWQGVAG